MNRCLNLLLCLACRAEEFDEGYMGIDMQPMRPLPRGQRDCGRVIFAIVWLLIASGFASMWYFEAPLGAYPAAVFGAFLPIIFGKVLGWELAKENWERFKRRHPERVGKPENWKPYQPFETIK